MSEEKILSMGISVEDEEFLAILRSRLHQLLPLTRRGDMFPGAQPVSFERRHLDWLEHENFYVCEKSDGVRYLLYYAVPPSGPVAFLVDRNYGFRALDSLTLPTRDLKAIQEETLLDGEMVWDARKNRMIFYIFDALMFQGRNLTSLELPGRLQVVQNDVIAPWEEMMKRACNASGGPEDQLYPFALKLKQMWKPYGLRDLFEQVIPRQGHENDGLIFTPVNDPYVAGTCHRLLKWKPSELNTIDFMMWWNGVKGEFELHIATQGRTHFYLAFDALKDEAILKAFDCNDEGDKDVLKERLSGKIAEFQYNKQDSEVSWRFLRLRPDKRLPNDSKTVEKVLHSISDDVTREDLMKRETVIRNNWKAREAHGVKPPHLSHGAPVSHQNKSSSSDEHAKEICPRSQKLSPAPFSYPLSIKSSETPSFDEAENEKAVKEVLGSEGDSGSERESDASKYRTAVSLDYGLEDETEHGKRARVDSSDSQ